MHANGSLLSYDIRTASQEKCHSIGVLSDEHDNNELTLCLGVRRQSMHVYAWRPEDDGRLPPIPAYFCILRQFH